MSALTRAFTTRRVKDSLDAAKANNAQLRQKISAPVQLVHTTNMLSYNAPDIQRRPTSSSHGSTKSDDDSDGTRTVASSPPTSPDVAPGESCLSPTDSPVYFKTSKDSFKLSSAPANAPAPSPTFLTRGPPAIPKRSPSHTKKASYDAVSRSRSLSQASKESARTDSTKASFAMSRSPSSSTATSHTPSVSITPSTPPMDGYQKADMSELHPFGQELAQVTELAEQYGVREKLQVIDEEEQELRAKGFCKFSAEDYLCEVNALFSSFFHDARHNPPMAPVWI